MYNFFKPVINDLKNICWKSLYFGSIQRFCFGVVDQPRNKITIIDLLLYVHAEDVILIRTLSY